MDQFAAIDALVAQHLGASFPAAQIVIHHRGAVTYAKAFGFLDPEQSANPTNLQTRFDLASVSKLFTVTAFMTLMQAQRVSVDQPVCEVLPTFCGLRPITPQQDPLGSGKLMTIVPDDGSPVDASQITFRHLLTHTSGLPAWLPVWWMAHPARLGLVQPYLREFVQRSTFAYPTGTRIVYSDVGLILLGLAIEQITGQPLDVAVRERVTQPLGLPSVGYGPIHDNVAPTEYYAHQGKHMCGEVHDENAWALQGVAGHAGLFSTADDLARYAQMLLTGGVVPVRTGSDSDRVPGSQRTKNPVATAPGSDSGRRILSAQTVAKMTQPYVVAEDGSARGLGWDMNTSFSANRGDLFPLGSFGHTGFTGTGIWIDPTSQTFYVFLSNRVHPDGKGDATPLRGKVATVVASAIEDLPIEKWKEAEAKFNATVAAQIPGFKERVEASRRPAAVAGGTPAVQSTVSNGIDVLERSGFKDLEGKRIGLVTNHTGRNLAGKPTIDILHEAKSVKLVSIFAPEHGIRGELDTEKIDDTKDEKTGLPVYSLYKDGMRRPKPEQLKDLDAIVYDIQDIGARFYTYTATLKNVMEEAAKAKIPVYVLDRPNPINGNDVEGSLADEDKLSFIAAHTIPVRYGLTIGELGQMMNAERKIGADLRVIKMEGWSRSMWFDETGQTWVHPSPNMRSLTQATLYPGIGLLETTNLSVGRGTDTPFEVIGAPWLDGQRLAKHLNERRLPGVRFVPVRYKPNASVFKNEDLGGMNIVITDRSQFKAVRTGIEIAAGLRKLYPTEWNVERYGRLLVNAEILVAVTRGDSPEAIEKLWNVGITNFDKRRASYLLYK
ncbi:MAG: exo-beta-N-acetylmuramidase NamZ domain-containing protein [Pyrinomonadaceae bacterium]